MSDLRRRVYLAEEDEEEEEISMNRERVQKLRDHVASVPLREFTYANYFDDTCDRFRLYGYGELPPCGTAACVAGHTLLLFREGSFKQFIVRELRQGQEIQGIADQILEIDEATSEYLFLKRALSADRQCAVDRLDHLLVHGELCSYDFDDEEKRQTRRIAEEGPQT